MSPSLLRGWGLAVMALVLSGCSTFDTHWRAAGQPGSTATRWTGRWTSKHHVSRAGSPMGGRLQGVFEPAASGQLTAYFRANWMTVFSGDYEMTLQPKVVKGRPQPGVQEFTGTHDLPKIFGGTYRYEAKLAGDQFQATYDSSYDRGEFSLRRADPKPSPAPSVKP